jgi:phosphoribosylaminoimidazole-succinocarboxamide synthase
MLIGCAAAQILGQKLYDSVERVALELYKTAAAFAESKGVLIADTKFEFGLLPGTGELILVDEVLTPDSSRYWPKDSYAPGGPPPSFDKQYVRDWLVSVGYRPGLESGPEGREGEGWSVDEPVVQGTRERYVEVVRRLTKS